MVPAPKVEIRGLTKAFPLRKRKQVKGISTDSLVAVTHLLRHTLLPQAIVSEPDRESGGYLFALDDVSIDVPAGEVLGVIGRNGAGKSTLLKVLARVLDPTSGSVTMRGRVVSLLELGVGFAPDLSVRENIDIYGRLAGIPNSEIRAAEERILEFANLAEYRNVPLEQCPSGAAVQLAFSAMVSFKGDIILADEVLTIGDAKFRKMCEERIRSAGQSGEAVLFVSHDMNAVRRICTRVLWLDRGRVRQVGPVAETVDAYVTELLSGRLSVDPNSDLGAGCSLIDVRLLDAKKQPIGALQITEPAYLDCVFRVDRPDIAVTIQFELWQGKRHVLTGTSPAPVTAKASTTFRAGVFIPADYLNDTPYKLKCRLFVQPIRDRTAEPQVAAQQDLDFVVMNPVPGKSVWSDWEWGRGGLISPRLTWTIAS